MFVKICGLTNREDALAAVNSGAKAIGFVFAESPRRADPAKIAPWIGEVPEGILKVGVFVNEEPAIIEGIATALGLNIAQLHGAETPDRHPRNIRVWRAFRVMPETVVPDYPAEAILIDGARWDWARATVLTRPLILAGGLNETNVAEAIRAARRHVALHAVDVSSGIEAAPGRKDHVRMKQFIERALAA